jgi:hypothetical protein
MGHTSEGPFLILGTHTTILRLSGIEGAVIPAGLPYLTGFVINEGIAAEAQD